jgi:extracellular matrix protein 14
MPRVATVFHNLLALCAYLLIVVTSAVPSRSGLRLPSPAFQIHENVVRPIQSYQRPWTRLRDTIIQHTFSLPKKSETDHEHRGKDSRIGPPANLLAKYGSDVVLRFNVSTINEAIALSDATKVLILDVWEFTDEWVDIRLAKDVVSRVEFSSRAIH